ncbi:MAG: GNAT family N-acetyltransferase [Microbacterium enclense]
MVMSDTRSLPLDATSAADLQASGLDYVAVSADDAAFEPFLRAVVRGFLGEDPSADEIESARRALTPRRLTGVFDRDAVAPGTPVATVDSWATELTVSPGRTVPLWSISAVTVSPTHRRRGIARAMLTGELRTAAAAGFPLAGLTVTEATIYGRWGFSPAAWASDVVIDTRRARWSGPVAPGRLDFVSRESLPERLRGVHERVRVRRPGSVPGWEGRWRGVAGLTPDEKDAKKVRAVSYRDVDGEERGILVYTLDSGPHDDYSAHELNVRALFADGDEAAAALWRFAIEHDLVGKVTASLQPTVPPVQWMVSDRRAVTATLTDHHWLRVLDVPGALTSRRYTHALDVVVQVDDPLGFAEGAWSVRVDESGEAVVETATADRAADLEMSVNALGSILLGGVRASELAAAGLVRGSTESLAAVDRAFVPETTPLLDIWY